MSEAPAPRDDVPTPDVGRSLAERVLGALRLDGSVYDEVAGDPTALGQAAGVAAAASVVRAMTAPAGLFSRQGLVWAGIVFLFWLVSSATTWGIARALGHGAHLGRLLRACGLAMAPFLLLVVSLLPVDLVRVAVAFLSTALLLAAFVVAVRQALRVSTGRAAFVVLIVFTTLFLVTLGVAQLQGGSPA
jgi:hypothetical protein